MVSVRLTIGVFPVSDHRTETIQNIVTQKLAEYELIPSALVTDNARNQTSLTQILAEITDLKLVREYLPHTVNTDEDLAEILADYYVDEPWSETGNTLIVNL